MSALQKKITVPKLKENNYHSARVVTNEVDNDNEEIANKIINKPKDADENINLDAIAIIV